MRRPILLTPMLLTLVLLGACSPGPELEVTDAWVRAVPPGASATAAYFVLVNHSDRDRALAGVASEGIRVEIHETTMEDGVMRMRKLDGLAIPAHRRVAFAPRGRHLMLFADELPAAGDQVRLELRFADGQALPFVAPVRRGTD